MFRQKTYHLTLEKLFSVLFFLSLSISLKAQTLIINEVSNGPAGSQEYVEFVVIDTAIAYDCNGSTPPCVDIRGWIFDDNSGYHGAGGVASGAVRFSQDPLWSCVPVGTIILIYNSADPNTSLPANDVTMSDNNCRIVAPIGSALFETNTTTPGAVACSYPATGWTTNGNWTNTALANTGDCARLVDENGCEVFSLCYGSTNTNTLIYFSSGGTGQDNVWYFNDGDPYIQSNWTEACADPAACGGNEQTPGAPNNAANAAYIAQFNNGCAPIPPVSLSATSTNSDCTCNGTASANASGSLGTFSYVWFDQNFNPINQTTANATGLCAGTYHVIATSGIGCSDTSTVTITQSGGITASTILVQNASGNGLCDGSANSSISGGTGPYTFLWSNGQNSSNAGGLCAGTYCVSITDALGCSDTACITITEPSALNLTLTPNNLLCNGTCNGSISSTVNGGVAPYTYAWSNGSTANGISGLCASNYSLTVTDANGNTATANTNLTQPAALVITSATASDEVCFGACNGSLSASASGGTGSIDFQWFGFALGANQSNVCPGTYTLTITDDNNCVQTSSATVNAALETQFSTSQVNPNCVNPGSASVTVTSGDGPFTYDWGANAGNQITPTATNLLVDNYTVAITNANGCVSTASFVFVAVPEFTLSIGSQSDPICSGGNDGIAWVHADGFFGPYTYQWSANAGGITDSIATTLTAGNYQVIATDLFGCDDTVTFTLTDPLPVTVSVSPDQIICPGSNTTITANANGGSGNYTFSWNIGNGASQNVNPTTASYFNVFATDDNGCVSALDSVFVDVYGPMSVNAGIDQTVCPGQSASLTANASGGNGGPYTYNWSNGMNGASIQAIINQSTSFIVTATSACPNMSAIDTVVVFTESPIAVNFSADQFSGCAPLSVNFSNTSGLSQNCVWNFGNGTQQNSCGTVSTTYTATGCYDVSLTIESAMGCSYDTTIANYVCVLADPIADFSMSASSISWYAPNVLFTNTSTGATSYTWDIASLQTDTNVNTNYTFDVEGADTYTVCLTATNAAGCADTDCQTITVQPAMSVYVPNAFTPDDNGNNDYFFPVILGYDTNGYEFQIFNRWGELIFSSTNPAEKWDGKEQGKDPPVDVYVWKLRLKEPESAAHKEFIGHVCLVR
jgi:gliding motility-associated-like protein